VNAEALVVDDGSTDGTAAWIAEHGDPRVRLIRHSPRGAAAARNVGIAEARAPWVAFLDDDDHWSPQKLVTQISALEITGAVFSYAAALVIAADGEPTEVMAAPPADKVGDRLLRQNVMPAGSSNVVASTEVLRKLHGFDEELRYFEDWDLWIRLSQAGRGVACDDTLVAYVRHPGRTQVTGRAAIATLDRLRARHAAVGFAPDEGRLLSWVASEQRRRGRRADALAAYLLATTTCRNRRWLTQILATPFDSVGLGLRNRVLRRERVAPAVTRPEWVPAP
jgi:glycosyltransferase involved in cell wall biosynthesis